MRKIKKTMRAKNVQKKMIFVGVFLFGFSSSVFSSGPIGVRMEIDLQEMKAWERVPLEDRYIQLKKITDELQLLGEDAEDQRQVAERKKQMLINSLRSSLFRDLKSIQSFYQFREAFFLPLFEKRQAVYLRESAVKAEGEPLPSVENFKAMQTLEMKLLRIKQNRQSIEKKFALLEIRQQFKTLYEKYKRYSSRDPIKKREVQIQILELVVRSAEVCDYPEEAIDKIKKKRKDLLELSKLYSEWDRSKDANEAEFVSLLDPAYEPKLPSKATDDNDPKGRKNYMNTIVLKEKDHRLNEHKHKPRLIKDKAFVFSAGKEVKRKVTKDKQTKDFGNTE